MNLALVDRHQRLPALDGLRGLAIIGVLACHFIRVPEKAPEVVSRLLGAIGRQGWLGVDLFFVLSGFLITGILLDSRDQPHFFRNFYARRVLRIFPLYYSYLLAVLACGLLWWIATGPGPQLSRLWVDWCWALPFMINFKVALANVASSTLLNHLWSLAVEEQFYLVWPALIGWAPRRLLAPLCTALLLLAVVARWTCARAGYPEATVMLMPCRTDSLGLGALLALGCRRDDFLQLLRRVPLGALPLVLVVIPAALYADRWLSGALFPLAVALNFAALLLLGLAASPASLVSRLLGSSLLRAFGKYSFGLYVLNQPVAFLPHNTEIYLWLADRLPFSLAATLLYAGTGIALTFGLAWISWQVIEQPCLKLKERFA